MQLLLNETERIFTSHDYLLGFSLWNWGSTGTRDPAITLRVPLAYAFSNYCSQASAPCILLRSFACAYPSSGGRRSPPTTTDDQKTKTCLIIAIGICLDHWFGMGTRCGHLSGQSVPATSKEFYTR